MIGLVWYLIASGRFDYKALAIFLNGRNILVVFAVILILLVTHMFLSKRYEIFLDVAGYKIRFKNVFYIIMIGVFYNNFLPGGTGGDLMRIYYLKSRVNVPIPQGSAITIFDRILGMLGLVVVAAASFFWMAHFNNLNLGVLQEQKILLLFAVLLPILAVGGLFLLRIPAFYNFIEMILSKLLFGRQIVSFMSSFQLIVTNTKAMLKSFGLCLIGHMLTLTCISLLAYTLYGANALYVTAGMAGIVLLTAVVPVTPGNIGWTEWLADTLFRLGGIEGGATIFALWRVVSVLFSLIGGVIYLLLGGKKGMGLADLPKEKPL